MEPIPTSTPPFHLPKWFVIFCLLFIPPVAWWHMWKNHRYHSWFPYVLWLNAAVTFGFAAYVIVHFYPLLTKLLDTSTYIFASHIGLLLFACFEIAFGFYLVKMFKNEAVLRRRVLAIVIFLLFLNAIAIPISQLVIGGMIQDQKTEIPTVIQTLSPRPSLTPASQLSCNIISTQQTKNWYEYRNNDYRFCLLHPANITTSDKDERSAEPYLFYTNGNVTSRLDNWGNDVVFYLWLSMPQKDFTAIQKSKAGDNVPEAHHASNSNVYKIKDFSINSYPAIEYIDDRSAPAEHELSYSHVIAVKAGEKILAFHSSAQNKEEQLKKDKDFSQILSTFTFLDNRKQEINPDTSTWKTYTNKNGGFSIKYPPMYELLENMTYSVDGVKTNTPDTVEIVSDVLPQTNTNFTLSIRFINLDDDGKLTLERLIDKYSWCSDITAKNGENIMLNQKGAILFEDSQCGPNGTSVIYQKNGNNLYQITIESHLRYAGVQKYSDPILSTFRFLDN